MLVALLPGRPDGCFCEPTDWKVENLVFGAERDGHDSRATAERVAQRIERGSDSVRPTFEDHVPGYVDVVEPGRDDGRWWAACVLALLAHALFIPLEITRKRQMSMGAQLFEELSKRVNAGVVLARRQLEAYAHAHRRLCVEPGWNEEDAAMLAPMKEKDVGIDGPMVAGSQTKHPKVVEVSDDRGFDERRRDAHDGERNLGEVRLEVPPPGVIAIDASSVGEAELDSLGPRAGL